MNRDNIVIEPDRRQYDPLNVTTIYTKQPGFQMATPERMDAVKKRMDALEKYANDNLAYDYVWINLVVWFGSGADGEGSWCLADINYRVEEIVGIGESA